MIKKAFLGIALLVITSIVIIIGAFEIPFNEKTKDKNGKINEGQAYDTSLNQTNDKPVGNAPQSDGVKTEDVLDGSCPTVSDTKIDTVTPEVEDTSDKPFPTPSAEPTAEETEGKEYEDVTIRLYISGSDKYISISLEEYVTGVVLAEMSYLSPIEAIKAQAVAARSYCLNRSTKTVSGHALSAVCDRSSHCMGYRSYEDMIKKYGKEKGKQIWDKIYALVMETRGEYLTYNGKYISAMFHDSSSGCTGNAFDVYGDGKDYLVSVETPEKASESTRRIGANDIIKKLFDDISQIKDISTPVGAVEYYKTGKCKSVEIYGKRFTVFDLFLSLGLRSMDLEVSYENGEFVILTRGFGHGLGMSQQGAKEYARQGMNYREILMHYYSGCEIKEKE